MASLKTFTYTEEDLTRLANQIMQIVEEHAFEQGVLDEEEAFSKRFVMTVAKPGLFTSTFDTLKGWAGLSKEEKNGKLIFQVLHLPQPKRTKDFE
jgi:hypothetical protein